MKEIKRIYFTVYYVFTKKKREQILQNQKKKILIYLLYAGGYCIVACIAAGEYAHIRLFIYAHRIMCTEQFIHTLHTKKHTIECLIEMEIVKIEIFISISRFYARRK